MFRVRKLGCICVENQVWILGFWIIFNLFVFAVMASSSDSWLREFSEASKLADDISARIGERGSLPPSGPESQRHLSSIRRKITILGTRLDSLESLLSKLSTKQPMYAV